VGARSPCTGPSSTPDTWRELAVLTPIAEASPTPGIATRLGLSEHTLEVHVRRVLALLARFRATREVEDGVR
jgi:DNA-binding NarL/FixJ family response regulator